MAVGLYLVTITLGGSFGSLGLAKSKPPWKLVGYPGVLLRTLWTVDPWGIISQISSSGGQGGLAPSRRWALLGNFLWGLGKFQIQGWTFIGPGLNLEFNGPPKGIYLVVDPRSL